MLGDLNRRLPVIRTRSVRHLTIRVPSHGWVTLCSENRGPATPWVNHPTFGLRWPSQRLGRGIEERPLCADCTQIVQRFAEAISREEQP